MDCIDVIDWYIIRPIKTQSKIEEHFMLARIATHDLDNNLSLNLDALGENELIKKRE